MYILCMSKMCTHMKFIGVQGWVDSVNYFCKLYACISICMLCRHAHMQVLYLSVHMCE